MNTMKKNIFLGVAMMIVAISLTACGGSSRMAKATSTRVDLARSVRVIPSLANLSVNPNRVSATLTAMELESLNKEQMLQSLAAKALATVNGDLLIAPTFSTAKGPDGKMSSMSVVGYAASITSFRTMTEADFEQVDADKAVQKRPKDKVAMNTMTVAEVEYIGKKSFSLSAADLVGKKESDALKLAREKMLRQEKMDVLFDEQYSMIMSNGTITSFTLTAFPGKYVNYRQTTMSEQLALKPTTKPVVYYQTIAADIQTVGNRVQYRFSNTKPDATEAEIKEIARNEALKLNKADFLLNETFYFDKADKVITHITICGTPAVYANFRPLQEGELVDVKLAPFKGDAEAQQKVSFFDLFKKKE